MASRGRLAYDAKARAGHILGRGRMKESSRGRFCWELEGAPGHQDGDSTKDEIGHAYLSPAKKDIRAGGWLSGWHLSRERKV